ncbi:MAG: hypothetical protein FWE49_05610 [Synergistaceae bacterium]|nr:hypothetical protein [Synergistaceae bacterium]
MLLGIDPGVNKCGWAIVNLNGELYASGIVPSDMPEGWFKALALTGKPRIDLLQPWIKEKPELFSNERVTYVILGKGTGSKNINIQLERFFSKSSIILAEEKYTTLKARDLYWKLHPPSGLLSLLPKFLLYPPRDIDDLAAWAIVLHKIETEKGV